MNFNNVMLSEKAKHKRLHTVLFHLHEILEKVNCQQEKVEQCLLVEMGRARR